MSKASIPSLAKQFLSIYDAVARDQVWKQQQEKFRSFWANRVLATTSAPLSEDECDVIIRILDAHAKGNTKDSESVARVMVTQKTWRRMFTELRANQKLAGSINHIFETDNLDQKAVLIDQLYEMNKGQKNYLTTPSANTLNALLAAYDPFKNLTVVSLNDRRRLIEFLEIPVPFDWEKTPIGTRIVQTNRILYDGLLAAGIQGSPRTASKFCYFEPVKALWKPEDAGKRRDDFLTIMRRYRDEQTVFCSAKRGARYAIQDVDENSCTVTRLDATEVVRCTTSLLAEKLQLIRSKGGAHPFDNSFASTSAIRNCILQSKRLALSADTSNILDVSDPERSLNLFCEILRGLRVDESSGHPKLYKPAMMACVFDGIRKRELRENQISFDWIAPRFIEKMAGYGEQVGEREAAMPFFHLTGDLFWMLSYRNLTQLVSDGSEGPAAVRDKVSHASIKDTFWDILQNPQYLEQAETALAAKWWGANRTPRFWVEKTIESGRPDRQEGDQALGRALWSPQTAEDGKDIYRGMLEIRPGDVVFHFIDNQKIEGFSTVANSADPSFIGMAGTEYEGRPAYRVDLKDHQTLVPPIDRAEFLEEKEYRPLIQQLLDNQKGLFFNREFKLNQGAYITEAPVALVRIWDDIHRRKTGSPICRDWDLTDDVRYWKIAPGKDASYWPACRDKGFIAIEWDELGDLSKMTREQFVKQRDELIKLHGWKAAGVDQAWKFSQIQVGDRIVANRGTDQVLGIGTVTGPYFFVDGEKFAHRLPVRWDDLRPRPVNEGGWRKTLIEIGREKFSEISKAPVIPPRINLPYSLEDCAEDTGFDLATLQRWKRGLERKGQAIFYGPPGTGKTFIAEKLTGHLIGGTDGIRELVQFHPAYSYEDFMQGIRPQTAADGSLAYPLVPGRFMEFCERAARRRGLCVLIIDEINRANLSRVLGELMYLLEYRNREMPLAGGGMFCIPENVRLIGTMNTADRSIALVDHALRRRFTFFPLYPDYEILSRYQQAKGFDAARLIQLLKRLNTTIADRHYEVGITFFLRDNLESQLADIWQMEIEPYLEEFFFDQPQKFELFRWKAVQPEILP
jgi:MoxR-like ATPase